jgi:hypothetical protein
LSFRDMQATFLAFYPKRPIPGLTCTMAVKKFWPSLS